MSQLTIYVDEETRKKVALAARRERTTVSRWVAARLRESLQAKWPANYDEVLGALRGSDLERPAQPRESKESKRELL